MKQAEQAKQISWVFSKDISNAEYFLEYSRELKAEETIGQKYTVVVNLNGSPLGINISGDPDEAISDLESLDDKRFISASLNADVPDKPDLKISVSINFSLCQININGRKAPQKIVNKLFKFTQTRYPTSPELTDEESVNLTLNLTNFIKEAEKAVVASQEAEKKLKEIEEHGNNSASIYKTIKQINDKFNSTITEIREKETNITNIAAEFVNKKAEMQADLETVRASRENIGAIEAKIQEFHKEIDDNKQKLTDIIDKSKTTIENNTKETNKIINENKELQKEIKEHLQKAVGESLFTAFQKRKEQILHSKWAWAVLTILAIVSQAFIFIWLAQTAQEVTADQSFYQKPSFLLRSLASIPIIFFIGYAIRQYAREREFEELYSFKAAISFSLSPYLELVKDLSKDTQTEPYRDFVVKTVGQIFENPIPDESGSKHITKNESTLIKDILDRVIKFVETNK